MNGLALVSEWIHTQTQGANEICSVTREEAGGVELGAFIIITPIVVEIYVCDLLFEIQSFI